MAKLDGYAMSKLDPKLRKLLAGQPKPVAVPKTGAKTARQLGELIGWGTSARAELTRHALGRVSFDNEVIPRTGEQVLVKKIAKRASGNFAVTLQVKRAVWKTSSGGPMGPTMRQVDGVKKLVVTVSPNGAVL